MADMVDLLVEDIVEVTETLIDAEDVDIEALAHPNPKPTLNERLHGDEKWGGWGKWGKQKAEEYRAKMKEHKEGPGLFRRGVC
jgi:hypothetical protein